MSQYGWPFRYVGDGACWIARMNPDFVHSERKHICIEVANRYHHQGDWSTRRQDAFTRVGWVCLVVFEDELENPTFCDELVECMERL